jgi:hypothetical protein
VESTPHFTWEKRSATVYAAYGHLAAAIVRHEPAIDGWVATAIVRGSEVHRSEHASRDAAMRAAELAARRACTLRRFQNDAPSPASA